ncbi:hypothetical protein [Halomonas elongata]|uniref:hypothetical protein n=1 Tax=Halomonas elongata TaxID=2746 RepID=UPI00403460C8
MDVFYDKLSKIGLNKFSGFFKNLTRMISSPSRFFDSVDGSDKEFIRSSALALVSAALMVLLSTPSYRLHGLHLDSSFFVISIVVNWILFSTYAFQTWFACKIFFGKGSVLQTMSAFFYSMSILVFVKMFEIPSRVIRDDELLSCDLTSESAKAMTQAVSSNVYSLSSEVYVGIGYLVYFIILFNLVRSVHKFGVFRSIIVSAISLYTISITVSYLQRPVIGTLLCAFKQNV